MSSSAVTITASSHHATPLRRREIDAARALLGVAPHSFLEGDHNTSIATRESNEQTSMPTLSSFGSANERTDSYHRSSEAALSGTSVFQDGRIPDEDIALKNQAQNPRSNGLETLAELAEREQNASNNRPIPSFLLPGGFDNFLEPSSTSPNQRRAGRIRSLSNPEGMEKWDSLYGRRHLLLPASILEEELADANEAVRQRSISPEKEDTHESVASATEFPSHDANDELEENDTVTFFAESEKCLDPDELLRQARSRLLEDVSSESLKVDGNYTTLPHSLSKYKEIYNKNGRIGIYTPSERAAIIARFNDKRSRRNWNKKIRYNCRKSLADRRLRVKGRFVKRSEQDELAKKLNKVDEENTSDLVESSASTHNTVGCTVKLEVHFSQPDDIGNAPENVDVNDEEMSVDGEKRESLDPTEDLPYRRLRRYTIT